ncbi:Gx transporter family protein [Mollicutes bacterium LVI A0078]|nr:Gx transporter family protein [Mollicutes bacterium LVI A0075]WOO91687.1 Gx transporter family protein [Mollicutes bacterium LVI A0078]
MVKSQKLIETEKITNFALFISISIVLSIFEMLIPINFVIPGVKLGLGNMLLVILLDYYDFKELLVFQIIKISVTTFILGLFSIYLFSLSGGLLALVVMYSVRKIFKDKVTTYTLSMCGAIAHNIGQIIFAIYALKTPELIGYVPFLVVFGSITGFGLGYCIELIRPLIVKGINVNS